MNPPHVDITNEDGHDAVVSSRIVTLFADVCSEFFNKSVDVSWNGHEIWVNILRQLLIKSLGVC